MARKPRIHFPGAVYHVMLRGNGGQGIFFSAGDRTRFYLLLQEGVERYGHRIHAFCLMDNHVHLAIQVGDVPLSKIIQNLSFRYTRYINTVLTRTGHLFQGRYKAILVDADSCLLQLVRYIHNNPVRSGITRHCDDYQWSSHPSYCGDVSISWLETDWILGQFSVKLTIARRLYKEFISQGKKESRRPEFHHGSLEGRLLGDDTFIQEAFARAEKKRSACSSLEQIIKAVCIVYEIRPSCLAEPGRRRDISEARAMAALLVLEADNMTLTELAAVLRRDLSGLSQACGRLRKRLHSDSSLTSRLEKIKDCL